MVRHLPKIEELAGKATKHLRIIDGGIVVTRVSERIRQVIPDFPEACGHVEGCIPSAALGSIETVGLLRLGIGEDALMK